MTQVWTVVQGGEYEEDTVLGLFSTREKAEAYVARQAAPDYYEIYVDTLDSLVT